MTPEDLAGDALLVHCGREAFARAGAVYGGPTEARPGLHVSCARYVRDRDIAILGWDMLDARPDADDHPWPVHGILYSYGVPLIDNALLEPLAQACQAQGRYDFMLTVLPLKVPPRHRQSGESDCDVLSSAQPGDCWRTLRE